MKTTIKTIAATVMAGVLSVANVNANNGEKCKSFDIGMYQLNNSMRVRVAVDKANCSKVKITLKDEQGNELYSTWIAKNEIAFRCNVDMSQLKDGKYQFSITDGSSTETKEVVIATQTVEAQRFISVK